MESEVQVRAAPSMHVRPSRRSSLQFGHAPSFNEIKEHEKVYGVDQVTAARFWYNFRTSLPYTAPAIYIGLFLLVFFSMDNSDGYTFAGGALSFVSCGLVILSFFHIVPWRRHPSSLMLQISIMSFILSFIGAYNSAPFFSGTHDHDHGGLHLRDTDSGAEDDHRDNELTCQVESFFTQWALLARELWVLTLSMDLVTSITNPFASYRANLRKYHVLVWATAFLSAVVLVAQPSCQGEFLSNGTCWIKITGDHSPCLWAYILAWKLAAYLIAFATLAYAYFRISRGLESTYATRFACVAATFRVVFFYVFFFGLLVLMIVMLTSFGPSARSDVHHLENACAFLVSSRGFFDALVWFFSHGFSSTADMQQDDVEEEEDSDDDKGVVDPDDDDDDDGANNHDDDDPAAGAYTGAVKSEQDQFLSQTRSRNHLKSVRMAQQKQRQHQQQQQESTYTSMRIEDVLRPFFITRIIFTVMYTICCLRCCCCWCLGLPESDEDESMHAPSGPPSSAPSPIASPASSRRYRFPTGVGSTADGGGGISSSGGRGGDGGDEGDQLTALLLPHGNDEGEGASSGHRSRSARGVFTTGAGAATGEAPSYGHALSSSSRFNPALRGHTRRRSSRKTQHDLAAKPSVRPGTVEAGVAGVGAVGANSHDLSGRHSGGTAPISSHSSGSRQALDPKRFSDMDLSPQLNFALRAELLYLVTLGIQESVLRMNHKELNVLMAATSSSIAADASNRRTDHSESHTATSHSLLHSSSPYAPGHTASSPAGSEHSARQHHGGGGRGGEGGQSPSASHRGSYNANHSYSYSHGTSNNSLLSSFFPRYSQQSGIMYAHRRSNTVGPARPPQAHPASLTAAGIGIRGAVGGGEVGLDGGSDGTPDGFQSSSPGDALHAEGVGGGSSSIASSDVTASTAAAAAAAITSGSGLTPAGAADLDSLESGRLSRNITFDSQYGSNTNGKLSRAGTFDSQRGSGLSRNNTYDSARRVPVEASAGSIGPAGLGFGGCYTGAAGVKATQSIIDTATSAAAGAQVAGGSGKRKKDKSNHRHDRQQQQSARFDHSYSYAGAGASALQYALQSVLYGVAGAHVPGEYGIDPFSVAGYKAGTGTGGVGGYGGGGERHSQSQLGGSMHYDAEALRGSSLFMRDSQSTGGAAGYYTYGAGAAAGAGGGYYPGRRSPSPAPGPIAEQGTWPCKEGDHSSVGSDGSNSVHHVEQQLTGSALHRAATAAAAAAESAAAIAGRRPQQQSAHPVGSGINPASHPYGRGLGLGLGVGPNVVVPTAAEVIFNLNSKHQFRDFRPATFKRIRQMCGFGEEEYLELISQPTNERLSEGASGAFFFYCGEGELIVKTVAAHEARTLLGILDRYMSYLSSRPDSLLVRFLGLHELCMYGNKFTFVVMKNAFPSSVRMNEKYDIKGSWVNRHAKSKPPGTRSTCRYCNEIFVEGSSGERCPEVVGGHEATLVLKDNDMISKLRLRPEHAFGLIDVLHSDSDALCSMGLTDYSLLVGVKTAQFDISNLLALLEQQQLNIQREKQQQQRESVDSEVYLDGEGAGHMIGRQSTLSIKTNRISFLSSTVPAPTPAPAPIQAPVPQHAASLTTAATTAISVEAPALSSSATCAAEGMDCTESASIASASSAGAGEAASKIGRAAGAASPPARAGATTATTTAVVEEDEEGEEEEDALLGGFPARAVVAPSAYYLGVIDMLQTWSLSKRLERFVKVYLLRQPAEGISCMPPLEYKQRFQRKISRIIEHAVFVREVTGSWQGKREMSMPSLLSNHQPNTKAD